MYNNPYMYNYPNNYNQQNINDRIDSQIAQLQQMKEQFKNQQPAINQTFQLAPNNNTKIKYVGTIDDVNKEQVTEESAFFSKDLSVVWIKSPSGNIRIFEMKETKLKDEKDLLIDALMLQIEDLKKGNNNAKSIVNDDDESITAKKSTNVQYNKAIKAK